MDNPWWNETKTEDNISFKEDNIKEHICEIIAQYEYNITQYGVKSNFENINKMLSLFNHRPDFEDIRQMMITIIKEELYQ